MDLSNVQRTFCEEYVNNGKNGTQAYLIAYKSCKKEETASVNASRLLRNAKVQEYISELQGELKKKAIMTAEERMEWLTKIIKGEEKETTYYEGEEKKREPCLSDKMKALDLLNKMTGEYTENLNLNDNSKTTKILESINRQLGNKNAK